MLIFLISTSWVAGMTGMSHCARLQVILRWCLGGHWEDSAGGERLISLSSLILSSDSSFCCSISPPVALPSVLQCRNSYRALGPTSALTSAWEKFPLRSVVGEMWMRGQNRKHWEASDLDKPESIVCPQSCNLRQDLISSTSWIVHYILRFWLPLVIALSHRKILLFCPPLLSRISSCLVQFAQHWQWGWVTLCGGGCPVHCGMFSSVPCLSVH
jgi:hypothetical protein